MIQTTRIPFEKQIILSSCHNGQIVAFGDDFSALGRNSIKCLSGEMAPLCFFVLFDCN
jgi:hypothetical protein